MKTVPCVLFSLLAAASASAQSLAIFPDEYVAVPEGPLNSPNLPLANGTSRVLILYDAVDLQIPAGNQITKLGFRQDASTAAMDTGRTINLEIRMGWSTLTPTTLTTTFDNNYESPPVTVFGPANLVLPNLRDPANPLVDGRFFVTLSTPFPYTPAGRNLVVEYRCFGNSGGGGPWTYRLDRADYYSPVTYGPGGCLHSGGGNVTLTAQPTRPGLNYSCTMSQGPSNSPGFLLVQPGLAMITPTSLTALLGVDPACTLQVWPFDMMMLSAVSSASGSASWSVPVPNNQAYADYVVSSQALFFDFFAPGQLVLSRGSEVLTGSRPRTATLAGAGLPTSVTTGSLQVHYCPVAFFEHQ